MHSSRQMQSSPHPDPVCSLPGGVYMKKVLIFAALMAMATIGFAGVAKADSFSTNGVTFNATVTNTTVTVTVQCLDPSCVGYAIGDLSLKGFTFTGDPTDILAPSDYKVQNGGQNNGQDTECNM